MPAAPGPMTLLYPQWIPGEHGPTGPIADLVNLKIRAKDQAVLWRRDPVNLFAFHVDVPPGGSALDISFDFTRAWRIKGGRKQCIEPGAFPRDAASKKLDRFCTVFVTVNFFWFN